MVLRAMNIYPDKHNANRLKNLIQYQKVSDPNFKAAFEALTKVSNVAKVTEVGEAAAVTERVIETIDEQPELIENVVVTEVATNE